MNGTIITPKRGYYWGRRPNPSKVLKFVLKTSVAFYNSMNIALETYADYIVKQSDKFLIPVSVLNKLPELDSQILESDPIVQCKIDDIFTGDTLYIIEGTKFEEEFELFGYIVNKGETTPAYFDLSSMINQIETIFPYSYDASFVPTRFSELKGK